MKKYVNCDWCMNWTFEQKLEKDCGLCKNKRLVPDPKEVLCNNCGNTMCPVGSMNRQIPHGLVNARVVGGFDSYHLFDTTSYTFNLCELCLRNLFMNFKIKPLVGDTDLSEEDIGESSWDLDLKSYEHRLWEDNGGPEAAYKNGKCNFEKDCNNDAVYSEYLSGEFTMRCSCNAHKDLSNYRYNSELKPFIPNNLKVFI